MYNVTTLFPGKFTLVLYINRMNDNETIYTSNDSQ